MSSLKLKSSKVIAMLLAVVMLISMVPVSVLTVFAIENTEYFTVTVTDSATGNPIAGAEVRLEAPNNEWTLTVEPKLTDENGKAEFDTSALSDALTNAEITESTLVVAVSKACYEDYSNGEVIAIDNLTVGRDVSLVEKEKITLTGTVTNENGLAYEGATVKMTGTLTDETTTDADGNYSFQAYKSYGEYTITATAAEEKYLTATTTVTAPAENHTCTTLKLEIKQFTVSTGAGENGTITAADTVAYGDNKEVTATADEFYRIQKFEVDGTEIPEAVGRKTYTHTIENITSAKTVNVVFVRYSYKINFTVSENGEVKYNDGSEQTVAGGSVSIDKEVAIENGTITVNANPSTNYRVAKVIVDGTTQNFTENDKTYSEIFEINKDHTFEVEFKINTFTVETEDGQNGRSSVDKAVVDHNGSAVVTITPDAGYNIEKVTINGTETTDYTINDDESSYTLNISNITENTKVVVEYSEIPSITLDNVVINSSDALKTVEDNDVITYIYANNGEATFTTTKNGIRINGDRSTGKAYRTQTWKITESTLITKIEVYNGRKWENVTLGKNIQIVIDTTAPVVNPDSAELAWTNNDNVTISGRVTDENPSPGLSYIVWSKDNKLTEDAVLTATENKVALGTDGKYSFTSVDGEQEATYYIYAVDLSGNVSTAKTVKVNIDKKLPTITEFKFSTKENTVVQDIISFLTFGTICSEKMYVTVVANDETITSGLKDITLYCDGEALGTKQVTGNYAIFELTESKFKTGAKVSAKVTDIAGNISAITKPTDTGALSDEVKIDGSTNPTATITPASSVYTDATGKLWYAGNPDLGVVANDENTGIRNVSIKLNGKDITTDINNKAIDADFFESRTTEETFVINTSQNVRDGENVLEVVVTNNSGVKSETAVQRVYIDTIKPNITGFDFEPEDFVEGRETASTVEATDYGFYFKADTKVTISAKDNAPSAGVKSITYYTVDKDTGKSAENTVNANKDGQIEFTIKANFKGQIYAKATDNVDNVADQFVNPNSAIVEDETKHKEETHIVFTKDDTKFTINDGEHKELYATDVPVKLTVIDTYSGIRSIEWSVVAPYDTANNQSGKITVNNDKTFTSDSEEGWTIVDQESNLVTKMEKEIVVKNNSNNIVVTVNMIDRAGNSSKDTIEFSIDKTIPTIEVVYDNNEADEEYKDIYKADREAEITVTERNFRAEDIVYAINNSDKVIPTVVLTNADVWTTTVNDEDPDKTVHVAKIKYAADGDYTFDIAYKDNAENAAEAFAQHKFTIDKTIPVITVVYDNNDAQNGNYYKADRIATITIKEHNFDAARVKNLGVATDNNNPSTFPTISAWKDHGDDTYTATIIYNADSKYTFDIGFVDKAGNSIEDYTPVEFYIDKTAPTLEISGVADKSANNGTVAPVVSYSDTNFNKDAVTITLTGINNGKVDYIASYEDIANGQTYTYANFEKVQKVDDIYTLTAKLTDMAGNETEKTITFSANRFGSVYDLAEVKDIISKYLQVEEDIVFTETNVDSLDREGIKIKLTKNGTPTDLVEGTDYTVEVTGGNGQWSVYKYTIKKALFADDGRYSLSVYSKDAAGNVNENIDETKEAEISFGIDKTKPVIVPIDFESGVQYAVEMKAVSVEIKDNLVLEGVKIYLNGKEIEYKVDGETYTFDIPKSNSKQDVKIVAVDAAGNEQPIEINDFLVNTNIFVRWYNNTPLFVGSIIGVVVLALGITIFLVFFKKKKKEDEDK